MAYWNFKELPRRTVLAKYYVIKHIILLKSQKKRIPKRLALILYKCFDKKSSGSGVKSEIMSNQQLSEELHKVIIRKFEKLKI